MQIEDALVGTAAEMQRGIPLLQDKGTVHQHVQPGKQLGQVGIGLDLLQGETRPAPDGLVGFLLDAAGQFRKGIHLIEGIAAGEGHVGHLVGLDDGQQVFNVHLVPAREIP